MCFNPLPALRLSDNSVVITPYKEYIPNHIKLSSVKEFLEVGCGQCLECRLQRAREWSARCVVESQLYDYNYFLTLTYADNFLPVTNSYTGEILQHATLDYRDIKQFNNSLRKYFSRRGHDGIRFFVAGEYGDKTFRPHYHMLVFNLPLYDLQFYKKSELGDVYFNSPLLDRIWRRGFVVVGEFNSKSAGYTARYTLKKLKDLYDIEKFDKIGVVPEFVRCSNRPGIGRVWFEKNKDKLFEQGFIDVSDGSQSLRVYPGKYFKSLYKESNPGAYEEYVTVAKYKAETKLKMELLQTNLSEVEYLAVKQANLIAKTKILKDRSEI